MSEFDIKIDYYAVLGVPPTASQDDIQKAYHALAAKYHPDKHQGNELEDLAKEKLTQLNAAFGIVGNAERRARYDSARRAGRASHPPDSGDASAQPAKGARDPMSTVRTALIVVAVVVALPFLLRFIRNPRLLAIIAIAALGVWLVPRLLRRTRGK